MYSFVALQNVTLECNIRNVTVSKIFTHIINTFIEFNQCINSLVFAVFTSVQDRRLKN